MKPLILLTFQLFIALEGLAYEQAKIPFVSQSYCENFLEQVFAKQQLKAALGSLVEINQPNVQSCFKDITKNWVTAETQDKFNFRKSSLVVHLEKKDFQGLNEKESLTKILASYIAEPNQDLANPTAFKSARIRQSAFSPNEIMFELIANDGKVTTFAKEVSSTKEWLPFPVETLANLELPAKEVFEEGRKLKFQRYAVPQSLAAEYKARRLVSHFGAYLRKNPREAKVEDYCRQYVADQRRDIEYAKHFDLLPFLSEDDWNFAATHGLTEAEVSSLRYYTGSYFKKINPAIWSKKPFSAEEQSFYQSAVNGLEKVRPYQGKVWRYAKLPAAVLEQHQEGKIVPYDAFTSSTINEELKWPGAKYIIHSKTGKFIAPISMNEHEEEVLFAPGKKFKVLKRFEDEEDGLIIEMEEVEEARK